MINIPVVGTVEVPSEDKNIGHVGELNARYIDIKHPLYSGCYYRLNITVPGTATFALPIINFRMLVDAGVLLFETDLECQFEAVRFTADNQYSVIARSNVFKLHVLPSLPGASIPVPSLALQAYDKFLLLQSNPPYVKDSKWWVFNADTLSYEETQELVIDGTGVQSNKPTNRILYLENRNPAWGIENTEDPTQDTCPRIYFGNSGLESGELIDCFGLWSDCPYMHYDEEQDLWWHPIPVGADVYEIWCNKEDENYSHEIWRLTFPKRLPPEKIIQNPLVVSGTTESITGVYNYDTGKRIYIFSDMVDTALRKMQARYGSYDGAPDNKVIIDMLPLGFIDVGFNDSGRFMYSVEIPEFDEQGRRVDDVQFLSADGSYISNYVPVSSQYRTGYETANFTESSYGAIVVLFPDINRTVITVDNDTVYPLVPYCGENNGYILHALNALPHRLRRQASVLNYDGSYSFSFQRVNYYGETTRLAGKVWFGDWPNLLIANEFYLKATGYSYSGTTTGYVDLGIGSVSYTLVLPENFIVHGKKIGNGWQIEFLGENSGVISTSYINTSDNFITQVYFYKSNSALIQLLELYGR